jgi:hypothetical protein
LKKKTNSVEEQIFKELSRTSHCLSRSRIKEAKKEIDIHRLPMVFWNLVNERGVECSEEEFYSAIVKLIDTGRLRLGKAFPQHLYGKEAGLGVATIYIPKEQRKRRGK